MADARNLFILLETAAGYALFEVVAFDEIGSLLEGDTVTDLTRFGRAIKFKAFQPFETAHEALENANAIAEHSMTDTLSNFLEMNLPLNTKKAGKTAPWALGVIDPALATSIQEGLGKQLACRSDDTVREILRGCRYHLTTFVKGLEGTGQKAQLGLGHAYSRSKVKFNPARSDNMIIQSIALLDQMDKDLNTFAMRIREWYSWHFPELKDLVKDNIIFARTAALIKDRSTLVKDLDPAKLAALVEVTGDEEVAKAIVASAKTSMGMDCSAVDMINIINFTQRMVKMAEYRKQLSLYLASKMSIVAPNLSALIGDTVAARLISKAGSLTNLAKAPASTVQILGAEKALFRALKTKGNTPKYGLIYHSTFIGRADSKNKGRISRYLANKCSIATRIDTFSDDPSRLYGEKLRDQVEERLKFYETGAAPRRNVDVMEEVAKELKAAKPQAMDIDGDDNDDNDEKKSSKKKKKDKKRKSVESTDEVTEEKKSAKKDKKRKADDVDDEDGDEEEKHSAKKKKKEKKEKDAATTPAAKVEDMVTSDKKSDKKKKKKDKKEHEETPKSKHDEEEAVTPEKKSDKKKSDKKKEKKSKKDE